MKFDLNSGELDNSWIICAKVFLDTLFKFGKSFLVQLIGFLVMLLIYVKDDLSILLLLVRSPFYGNVIKITLP